MFEGFAKVAVLSPSPMVVEGLTSMLDKHRDRIRIVDAWSVDREEPDVVLYDVAGLADGDGHGLDVLVNKTASVVFAVGRDLRPDLLANALAQGVEGFFSMNVTEEELLHAVDSALTGWQHGDAGPNPVVGSSDSEQRAYRLGGKAGLSDREAEVLSLITEGLTNDEIAHRCFISINSVKTYIRTTYRKIGVQTRSQAVGWAIQHGFATHDSTHPTQVREG